MKKLGLAPATFLTLLLTGTCMMYAGWFSPKGSPPFSPRKTEARAQSQVRDPLNTEAALRFRRGQNSHWRAMVLQH